MVEKPVKGDISIVPSRTLVQNTIYNMLGRVSQFLLLFLQFLC